MKGRRAGRKPVLSPPRSGRCRFRSDRRRQQASGEGASCLCRRQRSEQTRIRRLVQAEGFGARVETLNATDAFLGSLPGNWYANIREPLINTSNLADLVPLNSVWSGNPIAPCPFYPPSSPPLMQVASGSTPFRLNLHVDDVGHTLIFGPTGSGKSTLLALIAAQFRR